MQLESTPFILIVAEDGEHLMTHTGLAVEQVRAAHIDEEGAVVLVTEHGPAEISGTDLPWALDRLTVDGKPVDDDSLVSALQLPSRAATSIELSLGSSQMPLHRLNFAEAPTTLGFERTPTPREGEKVSTRAMD